MSLIPQNTGVKVIIGILFMCVLFGVFYSKYRESHAPVSTIVSKSPSMSDTQRIDAAVKMEDGALEVSTSTETEKIKGGYFEYADTYIKKVDEDNKVVLFFNAPWSQTCQKIDKELSDTEIPRGLIILSTDYDSYTTLKNKYEIGEEGTFVLVDSKGDIIKKWLGGGIQKIISEI